MKGNSMKIQKIALIIAMAATSAALFGMRIEDLSEAVSEAKSDQCAACGFIYNKICGEARHKHMCDMSDEQRRNNTAEFNNAMDKQWQEVRHYLEKKLPKSPEGQTIKKFAENIENRYEQDEATKAFWRDYYEQLKNKKLRKAQKEQQQKVFSCPLCEKKYTAKSSLKRHELNDHTLNMQ